MSDRSIESLRKEILEISKQIISLIKRRMELCMEIGKVKQAEGLLVDDATVERQLRDEVGRYAESIGVDREFTQRLLTMLIDECIKVQPKPPEKKVLTHRDIARMAEALERKGIDVVRMDVGEPDFKAPQAVVERTYREMLAGRAKYTEPKGKVELRQALADYLNSKYGIGLNADNIIVTPGGAFGVYLSLASIVSPGDEVIVIDPSWPIYKPCVRYVGGRPITIETYVEDGWELDVDKLNEKISKATKAIILNYPSNPTGKSLSKKTFNAIMDLAKDKKITVISDEVYIDYNFTSSEPNTVLKLHDVDYAMVGSFSKSWGMTGFRVGYVVSNVDRINKMASIQSLLLTCIPEFIQYAAIEALRCQDDVRRNVETMKERVEAVCKALESLPLTFYKPDGAMYVFPRIDIGNIDSSEFAVKLLETKHVSVAPGGAFGNYHNFFRISLGQPKEQLLEGVRRIGSFLESL